VAVHGRDDGLEDLPPALEGVGGRLLPERAGELPDAAGAVAHVGPDAEGSPRAGDDGDPRLLLVAEAGEGVVQVAPELGVDRVQGVGSVVGDGGDVVVALVADGAGHADIIPVERGPRSGDPVRR